MLNIAVTNWKHLVIVFFKRLRVLKFVGASNMEEVQPCMHDQVEIIDYNVARLFLELYL